MLGKVKWFNEKKDLDLFQEKMEMIISYISQKLIKKDSKQLTKREEVSFDVEEGPKGPQATNVISQ